MTSRRRKSSGRMETHRRDLSAGCHSGTRPRPRARFSQQRRTPTDFVQVVQFFIETGRRTLASATICATLLRKYTHGAYLPLRHARETNVSWERGAAMQRASPPVRPQLHPHSSCRYGTTTHCLIESILAVHCTRLVLDLGARSSEIQANRYFKFDYLKTRSLIRCMTSLFPM